VGVAGEEMEEEDEEGDGKDGYEGKRSADFRFDMKDRIPDMKERM
jgi:hypothetical protein